MAKLSLLLYLTNNQLCAYLEEAGSLSEGETFDNYATGWSKFADFLKPMAKVNCFLLTDLIEEDFHRETAPHLFGSAKNKLLERRLNALYRDTEYRQASQQGREKTGRKDDQLLLSALTNPQLLKPWIDALKAQKLDISGIYSVGLLSELFFRKLNLGREPSLLISHQSSGLRQSFFQNEYLRFSRLAAETAWSAESIAEVTASEIGKARQFLASTRLLARDQALNVAIIANDEIIHTLKSKLINGDGMNYRFIFLNEVKNSFGFKKLLLGQYADALFLSLLAAQNITTHYATQEQTRSHKLEQINTSLNALSTISLLAGILWVAQNGVDAYQTSQVIQQTQLETLQALTKYQETTNSMPATVANPSEMKAAVDLEHTLEQNAPEMFSLLKQLSSALDANPNIKLHEFRWRSSETDPLIVDPNAPPPAPQVEETAAIPTGLLGLPSPAFQVLELECEVIPFTKDYRAATRMVEQFISALKSDTHLQISLNKPAIDVRNTVTLESKAGNDKELAKPTFVLQIVRKI